LNAITPREAALSVRGLRKAFAGVPVYDGFALDVKRGDILAIFGPNGCGKSTLINMAAGLLPADGGEILYDGRTIRVRPFEKKRRDGWEHVQLYDGRAHLHDSSATREPTLQRDVSQASPHELSAIVFDSL
jgi:ABC-type branched-subunit amino acid transport system ATPase component